MTDDMPARMRRFIERPPKRLRPETISSRRAKCIRRGQPRKLDEICEAQGWHCAYCNRNMRRRQSPKYPGRHATIDHALPISRGGRNQRDNLVAACYDCNRKKGSATADEFRAALAAGTQSAETNEDLAQSEGCQSGPTGQRPVNTALPAKPVKQGED